MNVSRIAAIGLLSVSAAALASTAPQSHVNPLPPALERIVQNVTQDLGARGYEVARGTFSLWGTDQCKYPIRTVGNCFANNPTSPYIMATVPLWRDEFVDQTTHLVFGPIRRGYSATYRLDEREALLVLAELPPGGAYFGLQTYVFTREGALNPDDPVYKAAPADVHDILFTLSPNTSRVLVFSSIGNSNNNVVVENRSGSAWGQQRSFIVTADAAMQEAVTAALLRAGVPDANQVFLEPVSADLVRLGLDSHADDLLTIGRYVPTDAAGQAWQQRLPLTILRVRDTNTQRLPETYDVPAYDAATAESELYLQGDFASLIGEVKTLWNQPAATGAFFMPSGLPPPTGIDLVGQHCLRRPMNCLGDSQDTDTYRISKTVSLDDGNVIAVVGTLATETGNATYVSLSVNWREVLQGVVNLRDGDLRGTASDFSVASKDKFYVTYFARDCTGLTSCREITESEVPAGGTIKIVQRAYIRPGTERGARVQDLLTPYLIVLDGSTRP